MRKPKTFNSLSVCSGIEAFSVATKPLDFKVIGVAEIDAFPSIVLAHRIGASRPRCMPDPTQVGLSLVEASRRRAAIKAVARLSTDGVPNWGDFTHINVDDLPKRVDWLVGGTPCQSFSVAGLRKGLADDRGNLTLEFVRLAHELARRNGLRGLLWENVPGCLSDRTNAFGCFLAGIVGHDAPLVTPHGGRWPDAGMVAGPRARLAWRILDSQHFGVPQRRRRVFVVADFGNGPDPAAVLFEPRGQERSAAAAAETGQDVAATVIASTGGVSQKDDAEHRLVIAHTLSAEGADASEDGSGRGTPLVVYEGNAEGGNADIPSLSPSNTGKTINNQTPLVSVFDPSQITSPDNRSQPTDDMSRALLAQGNAPVVFAIQERAVSTNLENGPGGKGYQADIGYTMEARNKPQAVAFNLRGREGGNMPELGTDQASALRSADGGSSAPMALIGPQVRRLLPEECEKLQGFPVGWTRIPGLSGWREVGPDEDVEWLRSQGHEVKVNKKGKARVNDPDGPRYKALGNSFTVEPINFIMARAQASMRGEPMPPWQPLRLWAQ